MASNILNKTSSGQEGGKYMSEECNHYWVIYEGWQNIYETSDGAGEWGVNSVKCVNCGKIETI